MEWLESLILGLVQGVTEFLPVSSDGHLTITQLAFGWLTGKPHSGEQNLFFDVMLHVGTLAAILFFYRKTIVQGVRGFLGASDGPNGFDRASIIRVGLLAVVATSPLVPFAIFFKDKVEELFQSGAAAAYGFLITAAVLALVSIPLKGPEGAKGPAQTTWIDALLIGIAQMFAPLPGVSRSGLTIAAALGLGFSRAWAVGFSLLIAVPAICGAAVFEIRHMLKDPAAMGLTSDRIGQTLAATLVAGVVGYAAILWLIRVVQAGRLWYFSVYLVILAILVLAAISTTRGTADVRPAKALDRSAGSRTAGPPVGRYSGRVVQPLARTDATGPRADNTHSGDSGPFKRAKTAGLVLV